MLMLFDTITTYMLEAIIKTLPFALIAAISPVLILFEIVILNSNKQNTINKTWFYIIGASLVLLGLGFIVLLLFQNLSLENIIPAKFSAYLDFLFAILLIWLLVRPRKKTKTKHKMPNTIWAYFAMGVGLMIVNVSSLIPYLALIKLLNEVSVISTIEKVEIMLINIFIILLPLIIPVMYCSIFKKSAQKFLSALRKFTNQYSNAITKLLIIAVTVYLIWHGYATLY